MAINDKRLKLFKVVFKRFYTIEAESKDDAEDEATNMLEQDMIDAHGIPILDLFSPTTTRVKKKLGDNKTR